MAALEFSKEKPFLYSATRAIKNLVQFLIWDRWTKNLNSIYDSTSGVRTEKNKDFCENHAYWKKVSIFQ